MNKLVTLKTLKKVILLGKKGQDGHSPTKEEYDISNERDVENFKRQRVEFDTIKDNEINKIQNLLNEFEKLRVEDLKSEIVLPK